GIGKDRDHVAKSSAERAQSIRQHGTEHADVVDVFSRERRGQHSRRQCAGGVNLDVFAAFIDARSDIPIAADFAGEHGTRGFFSSCCSSDVSMKVTWVGSLPVWVPGSTLSS